MKNLLKCSKLKILSFRICTFFFGIKNFNNFVLGFYDFFDICRQTKLWPQKLDQDTIFIWLLDSTLISSLVNKTCISLPIQENMTIFKFALIFLRFLFIFRPRNIEIFIFEPKLSFLRKKMIAGVLDENDCLSEYKDFEEFLYKILYRMIL